MWGLAAAGGAAAASSAAAAGSTAAVTTTAATTFASAAAAAAPYIAAASAVLGAVGSVRAGQQQQEALNANARAGKVNAGYALASGEAESARQQTATRRRLATAENTAANSGVSIDSGSPLDVMADIAAESSLDEHITTWKARRAANAYLTQSGQDAAAGDQAASAGQINAGTTLLTAAGRAIGTNYLPLRRV